ncbi:GAF domain-containing protein [Martelella endophytica]|uniref:Transcriptional regulator n=1 Tax=Martelella endophytica TaxID=1486262 RepID=A0A0D5LTU9_MAREN|nr:GAF domain-containing protein [Martelella endophytica]AJY47644.1 transcriptional regulator [Martelella endophytica]
MIPLESIRDAFEGIMPSIIATTDPSGIPNLSYLSHVYYVDRNHVALSNQFFSKTAANVRATGRATLIVIDGRTGLQHVLDLVFETSQESGPVFDHVDAHLDVMAALQDKSGMLKLKAVDIYRVLDCRRIDPVAPLDVPDPDIPPPPDHLPRLAALVRAIEASEDTERMLDVSLEMLESEFGFRHTLIMIADGDKLTTIASRGYPHYGFGAEISVGDGIIGVAAERARTIRISDMRRSQRYVSAVAAATGTAEDPIPMPLLEQPQTQMAVPLTFRSRVIGVLFAESETSFSFSHEDETALQIVGGHIAAGLVLAELSGTDGEATAAAPGAPDESGTATFRMTYYERDGSVFIDDAYVIRGVPGRLLHYFLKRTAETGRLEFTNREIRRDRSLLLPDVKDNLETRLILLRRRLDERGGPVHLERPARGVIRLVLHGSFTIETMAE